MTVRPENREARAAYKLAWQRAAPERKKEYQRRYHEKRKAMIAALPQEQQDEIRSKQKAIGRASYERNRETHLRIARETNRRNPDGRWAARILLVYGLTVEQYGTILASQGGVCAICQGPGKDRHLAVDHCHQTGVVRGLLCRPCNTAIGQLGDTAEHLQRAADYLRKATA